MPRVLVVDDSKTIRKVVTAILTRRGYDAVAAEDGQAALDEVRLADPPYDLVLLDFVMPKMNGYQFCRAMNERKIKAPPVVLMSAKSDRIRDHFVQQTGAVDAISKPFDAQALALVVENALSRIDRGAASASRLPDFDDEDTSEGPAALESIAEATIALSGDATVIPIGAVLQLLQVESQSGVLVIEREDGPEKMREVSIAMRAGLIDLVLSRQTGDEFRLGRYFVREKLVSEPELAAIVRNQETNPRDPRLLGERLLSAGIINEGHLHEALTRQSSELVYEVLRWPKGRFTFRRCGLPALAEQAKLGMSVPSIVMEGFRRVDEWRMIEARIGSFDAVLLKDPIAIGSVKQGDLTREERVVLDAINDERTSREVIEASHLSSFDACRVIGQMLEARIVRKRS